MVCLERIGVEGACQRDRAPVGDVAAASPHEGRALGYVAASVGGEGEHVVVDGQVDGLRIDAWEIEAQLDVVVEAERLQGDVLWRSAQTPCEEAVELREGAGIEQELDALARGELAGRVLTLDAILPAAELGAGVQLLELLELVLERQISTPSAPAAR